MGAIQDKIKRLQKEANERAMATIVEEPIPVPEDIDKTRLAEVIKEWPNSSQTTYTEILPTSTSINIDSLVGVIEDIPEDEPYYEETPDEIEKEETFEEDVEGIPEETEFPIEEPIVEDPKALSEPKFKMFSETSARHLTGLVVSVTTVPFTPAKRPTNGEKPMAVNRYQVLIEMLQPLQLGREYQILL